MKAYVCMRYGGPEVLELVDLPRPDPKPGEVLVRVHAATVSSGDVRVRGCDFPPGMKLIGRLAMGWNRPRQPILGTEFAGVVAEIGPGVTRFAPGDAVFAFPGARQGAHAEYAVVAEDGPIAALPEGLDFHQAASLSFGGTTALHFLRKAGLASGESMLVLGGSGAVGLALVQLAAHQGARVTATTSAGNRDLVLAHGAERVIDYRNIDPATLGERFDIVADTVDAMDFPRAETLLAPKGRYLAVAGTLREVFDMLRPKPEGRRVIAGPAEERVADIIELARLAAAGAYRAHIDRVFPFADLPAAHAYVDTKRKRGSVVVEIAG
jgi:NADPH:quinone reductase-like Zn-dependent oxidoreductase